MCITKVHTKRKEGMIQGSINTIVFDLVGVLFYINKAKALRKLGIFTIVKYYFFHWKNPFDECLLLLDKMRKEVPGEYQEEATYKGIYLPIFVLQWLKGLISSQEAFDKVVAYFDWLDQHHYFVDKFHKQAVIKLMVLLLDPNLGVEVYSPDPVIIQLIKTLKKRGTYKLFILSNIDTETYIELLAKYQDFFGLFDGIVTSCQTHLVKPDLAIFNYLVDTYELNPYECCYIDDQPENLASARIVGMQTILCKNARQLTLALYKKGIC